MSVEQFIDKKVLSILRYIYRRPFVELRTVRRKFDNKYSKRETLDAIDALKIGGYIVFQLPDGSSPDNVFIDGDAKVVLTSKGNRYVEDHVDDYLRWLLPNILSLLALVISIVALLLTSIR